MKQLLQHHRSKGNIAVLSGIHDLSAADFSDDSDSDSSDTPVVMLSWNNGQVCIFFTIVTILLFLQFLFLIKFFFTIIYIMFILKTEFQIISRTVSRCPALAVTTTSISSSTQ